MCIRDRVKAGEESGRIAETLATLGVQMERSSNLKKKIKGAMIYPAIVITILLIIGILMMIYVVPTITDTFKDIGVELPISTKIIIFTSDFMAANSILVLGGFVALIFSFLSFLRTNLGVRISSWVIVRLPVIGTMAKETNSARTARTLSSLLASGVNLLRALEITTDVVQNVYFKEIIRNATKNVEKGEPLSATFIERSDL